jgi:predicted transcriptional regulator
MVATRSIKGHEKMTESSTNDVKREEILGLTSEIVAAHVSNNSVALSDLPGLIEQVYRTLASVGGTEGTSTDRPTPAVPIKKSITPDFIVCLEDGKKLKMLKRHLKTAYNMTPEEYRERWGLSPDYPMVAPNYAKQRSRLAKQIGLGTRSRRGRQA